MMSAISCAVKHRPVGAEGRCLTTRRATCRQPRLGGEPLAGRAMASRRKTSCHPPFDAVTPAVRGSYRSGSLSCTCVLSLQALRRQELRRYLVGCCHGCSQPAHAGTQCGDPPARTIESPRPQAVGGSEALCPQLVACQRRREHPFPRATGLVGCPVPLPQPQEPGRAVRCVPCCPDVEQGGASHQDARWEAPCQCRSLHLQPRWDHQGQA